MSEMKSRASFVVINKVLRNRGGRKKGTQEEVISIVEVGNLEIEFSNSLINHREKITTMTLSGLDIVYYQNILQISSLIFFPRILVLLRR